MKEICLVDIGVQYSMQISNIGKYYEFELKNMKTDSFYYLRVGKPDTLSFGYNLFPYFGGDEVAPHNIEILMKKIS